MDTRQLEVKQEEIPLATTGLETHLIYADVIRGAIGLGEVTKLYLVEHRLDSATGEVKAVHSGMVVMPTSQLRGWSVFLAKLADGNENAPASGQ